MYPSTMTHHNLQPGDPLAYDPHTANAIHPGHWSTDDISTEKTEAINQCPGWIVFAMGGSYARDLLGWRLCWVIAEACMCLTEKSLGASLHPQWCRFSPHGEVVIYLLFHSFNAMEGRNGLSFGYLLSKLSKMVWFAPYKWTLSSKDHHKLPTPKSNNSLKTLNIRIGQRYVFRSPREEEL